MVLYALEEDRLIFAPDASTQIGYVCLECRRLLRLRRGRFKQPHFYHPSLSAACRLYSKSQRHLAIQLTLQGLLPAQKVQLEAPFLSIGRIADLFWEAEGLVFEIQCSPIYEREVQLRIRDYRALGLEMIWILDDRLYNKKRLKTAETFMRGHCAYFVSVCKSSLSVRFYDQMEIFSKDQRFYRGEALRVDFREPPHRLPDLSNEVLPATLKSRAGQYKKYFTGEILDPTVYQQSKERLRTLHDREGRLTKTSRVLLRQKVDPPYFRGIDWILDLVEGEIF